VAFEHIAIHHDGFARIAASAQGDAQAERGVQVVRLQPKRPQDGVPKNLRSSKRESHWCVPKH
jgi:hypothetical protein